MIKAAGYIGLGREFPKSKVCTRKYAKVRRRCKAPSQPFRSESSGVIFNAILERDPVPAVRRIPTFDPCSKIWHGICLNTTGFCHVKRVVGGVLFTNPRTPGFTTWLSGARPESRKWQLRRCSCGWEAVFHRVGFCTWIGRRKGALFGRCGLKETLIKLSPFHNRSS